jgi:hypothetical protein
MSMSSKASENATYANRPSGIPRLLMRRYMFVFGFVVFVHGNKQKIRISTLFVEV